MRAVRSEWVRQFSDLGQLQKPMTLRYHGEEGPDGFDVCLCREENGGRREEHVLLRDVGGEAGERLVRFLYENAVPIENWTDVLQEAQRRLR